MNSTIQISTKTADWIANVAREELENLSEFETDIQTKIGRLNEEFEKLSTSMSEDAVEVLRKDKDETIRNGLNRFKAEREKWEKVIEIMMTGEEIDNNTGINN